jgi:hypothetical protein
VGTLSPAAEIQKVPKSPSGVKGRINFPPTAFTCAFLIKKPVPFLKTATRRVENSFWAVKMLVTKTKRSNNFAFIRFIFLTKLKYFIRFMP